MSERISDIIVKIFMVLYVAFCAFVIVMESSCCKSSCCGSCSNTEGENQITVVEQNTNFETMEACLNAYVPAQNPEAKLLWLRLKEGAPMGELESYEIDEVKDIPAEKLAQILDKNYYIENNGNMNTGMYNPMAIVSYLTEDGKNVQLIYSFSDSSVDLSVNGEPVHSAMVYNPDSLNEVLESI